MWKSAKKKEDEEEEKEVQRKAFLHSELIYCDLDLWTFTRLTRMHIKRVLQQRLVCSVHERVSLG